MFVPIFFQMVHLLKFYEVFKLVEAIIKPSPYKVCPDYNFFFRIYISFTLHWIQIYSSYEKKKSIYKFFLALYKSIIILLLSTAINIWQKNNTLQNEMTRSQVKFFQKDKVVQTMYCISQIFINIAFYH